VHVESKYVRDTVLKLGCSQNKIVVTPFGVDLNFFQRDKYTTEVKRLKHRNGLTGSKVVISVRKFEKVFNIDCLLRAIPLVISEFPNAKFIIKGFGSEERNLKKLADKLDITRYVLFKGKISFSEMPVYLSSADIYVSTAIADSTSVSMLEAMASSLPIITTSIPANKEWIKDNWNGLLFKPSDYEELAEKIIILLGDADMCNMFGERNRRIVSVRAQWSKTLDILEATYKKVCEGVCRI
jgi:glycosyltransferase involved in cell wall biosynthesis